MLSGPQKPWLFAHVAQDRLNMCHCSEMRPPTSHLLCPCSAHPLPMPLPCAEGTQKLRLPGDKGKSCWLDHQQPFMNPSLLMVTLANSWEPEARPSGVPVPPRQHLCNVAHHPRTWQTPGEESQATERRQTGWEPGPSNQKGGDISGGGEGARGRTKEESRRRVAGRRGRCAKRWSVSQPSTHISGLMAAAVRTAFFSPSLLQPSPYLTLVRPLRSVHLLDMSIQVIGPGKETTKGDFRTRPPKMGPPNMATATPHTLLERTPSPPPQLPLRRPRPPCPGFTWKGRERLSDLACPLPPTRNSVISRT